MAQAQTPHAGVRIDPTVLGTAAATDPHEGVDPIPWKTGKVGVVPSIDAVTWSATKPPGAPASRPNPAPAPKATCGSDPAHPCGCAPASAPASAPIPPRGAPDLTSTCAPVSAPGSASAAPPAPPLGPRAKPKKKLPGSGIPPRRVAVILKWARRISQVGFFALFMYFLFQTAFRGSFAARADAPVRLPLPVEGFLLADPFVAAMTVLSTHTVYRGLLWSVGLLGLTMLVGRVFCGWICPFGTLHHFFGWLLPSKVGRGSSRVEANTTHTYQRAKYYLLYAFLVAGVAGSAIGGLFDPICIAVRSIGLGVIPGLQYLSHRGLGAAQGVHSRAVQGAADQAQDFLAQTVWQSKQFYFHQTWFIVFLLVAVLFANRFIPRFWCRVLCPLGAFLGVFSRFALFGMTKDHAKCTDCNLCLVHCQGADSPQGGRQVAAGRVPHVHELRERVPRGRDQVHVPAEPPQRRRGARHRAPHRPRGDRRRRDVLAGRARRRFARRQLPLQGHPAAGRRRGARLPRALHPLRRVHEGVPEQRAAPRVLRGGGRGHVDAHPHRADRLLRVLVRPLRAGVPDGRHPEDHREREDGAGRSRPSRSALRSTITGGACRGRCRRPASCAKSSARPRPRRSGSKRSTRPCARASPDPTARPRRYKTVHLQRPHVDPWLCVGCGACEKVCPVQDQPAVYVTSVGETRSKTNVILLENTNYNQKS